MPECFVALLRLIATLVSISTDNIITLFASNRHYTEVFDDSTTPWKVSKYGVFSGFLDNHLRYARVGIFNSQIKYTSPNFQYCYDVSFSMNLFNKIKSQLKLSLPFFIFCLGAKYYFYLFTFCLLYLLTKSDSAVILSATIFS